MRRNRRPSRLSYSAIAIAILVVGLAGCAALASPSSPSSRNLNGTCLTNTAVPLAVAVGMRSNVPTPRLPAVVDTLVQTAANNEQQISLIRIDGKPKVFSPPPLTTTAQNSVARSQEVAIYLNRYIVPILHGEIDAKVPQADVLSALILAAAATGPNGNIIIIDSGLQTVAPMAYQQGDLLMATPNDVVTFLRKQNLLPDLRGRHVLLYGFGYTASPQPVLNNAQRDNVIDQWIDIVKASGGCVTVDTTPNTASETAGLPPVSTVIPPPVPAFNNCGTIALSDAGTVGFAVDTATFRDSSAAQATLRQLARTLQHGNEKITLVGSTSSEGTIALNYSLSLRRAEAVKAALVSLGISPSRITTLGDGAHWPGRVNDIGPGGVLLPAQAEQNRAVIVQLPKCG